MDESARAQLAQRLKTLSLNNARKEIRALDPDAGMAFWRNTIWDEYHTLWLLPNAGLSVTLVEKEDLRDSTREIGGGPQGSKAQKAEFRYVEARVEPLDRPAKNSRRR